MAKNTTTLSYRVTFEGKQAKDFALDLKKQMESLGASVAATRKEIAELEKAGKDTSLKKLELSGLEADLKTVRQQYKKTVTEIKGYNNVLKNLTGATYNDLSKTSTALTNALKRAEPGTKKYKELLNQMLRVKEEINKRTLSFKDLDASQEKITKMILAMKDLDSLTGEALVEQRKYWEALAKGAEEGSRHQQRYKQNLETIIAEEQRRTEAQRQAVVNDPLKHSVEQIKEAIKLTEKLRDTKPIDSDDYKRLSREVEGLNVALKGASKESVNINKVIKHLDSQPIETLEAAAKELEERLRKMAPNTKAYIAESEKLRKVNAQIQKSSGLWKEHEGKIEGALRRLRTYVLVYGGFDAVSGYVKNLFGNLLELSDAMADVQKTTGIAGRELRALSREIDRLDTRTSQMDMHALAAVAGQIGFKESQDVLGFVSAADKLTVSLNELGQDGVQSLAKIAQLTGDIERLGVEKSLLAIGSAINELSANSAASAGPISDFMSRVGGLAPLAKLSTSDLAALGATANALGQSTEVAGTAMNKFIMSLITNSDNIAYALDIDRDTLNNLISTGQTMDAIIMVLEKVKSKGTDSTSALNDIFKELGGEGARVTQVISSMAENTEFLREQVNLSTKAFYEATSITAEYNVKNESAAAIMERIKNTWQEFFVSADNTTWLTDLLNKVLDLTKVITGTSKSAAALKSAIVAVGVAVASTKLGLTSFVNGLGQLTFGVKLTDNALLGHIHTLRTAEKGTRQYQHAVLSLKKAFAGNWLTIALTAVVGGIVLFENWNKKQRELDATITNLVHSLEKEKEAVKGLEEKLQGAIDSDEERIDLIRTINQEYGTYIDSLLNEAAGYNEIAAALKLVNEQLDLKYAKQIYEKRISGATEQYVERVSDAELRLLAALKNKYGEEDALAEFKRIREEIKNEVDASDKEFLGWFRGSLRNWTKVLGPGVYTQIAMYLNRENSAIRELRNAEIRLAQEQEAALLMQNANVEEELAEATAAQEELLIEQRTNFEKLMAVPLEGMTKEELKSHYETILNYGEVLIANAQREFDKKKAELDAKKNAIDARDNTLMEKSGVDKNDLLSFDYDAELKEISAPLEALKNSLQPIIEAYEGDAWNKALNIPGLRRAFVDLQNLNTASVDNLVQTYESLRDVGKKYTTAEDFNKHFGTKFKSRNEILQYAKTEAAKVKEQLKALGYTTSGDFDWSTERGRSEAEKEAKRQFEAAKAALKAYYEEQETIIKQAYIDRQITHEEMTRRISKNEQEQSEAFVDLYSVLLGEAKKYDTNIEEILKGKDLQKLGGFLRMFGPAMVDGIRLGREQSEGEIREEAIKMREILEKAIADGNVFEKLELDFKTTLDELSLLAKHLGDGVFEAVGEDMAGKLVAQLTGMADKAYTMTKEEFKKQASQTDDADLAAWWAGVDDEQLTLILEKLQIYYDDLTEVQRRYMQRMEREWQTYYKLTGGESQYAANEQALKKMRSEYDAYESMGVRKDYNAERGSIMADAYLKGSKLEDEIARYQELLKTKTAGSEEYMAIEQLIAEKQMSLNAIIQQSEIDTTNVTLEQWQKRAEALSGWAEIVGETMGEVWMLERKADQARVRGDEETAKQLEAQAKESRQNLVKEALNKAIDMAKVWAMELGFKVMYNALAKKSDEDVAASGAKASLKSALADIIAQGFKGAGKEVGSKGMAGLITGAVIIAAAAGLAALAKSAVNNMYPEATEGVNDPEATAPKRKLTTGMLTYAEGKYPVLGNDGVVYDAEYAGANMKTGVYRKPHFGIFAEKQPEMVLDGKTTQRLVLNYPEIYSGILELSRTGRMGMRTYAKGNVLEIGEGYDVQAHRAQQQMQMEEMRQTMAATAAALAALTQRLDQPIHAEMNYFGKGGAREAEQRGSRWATRNRVK